MDRGSVDGVVGFARQTELPQIGPAAAAGELGPSARGGERGNTVLWDDKNNTYTR